MPKMEMPGKLARIGVAVGQAWKKRMVDSGSLAVMIQLNHRLKAEDNEEAVQKKKPWSVGRNEDEERSRKCGLE